MSLWRTLSLLSLFVFTVSGPVSAQESLLQQQDVGVHITETAVPPAVDAMSAPSHAKKAHTAVSTHKVKKAKAHRVSGKKKAATSKKHKAKHKI